MKSIKLLRTKNKDLPLCVSHNSCIIDETFINKHCMQDEKRIKELVDTIKKEKMYRSKLMSLVDRQILHNENDEEHYLQSQQNILAKD